MSYQTQSAGPPHTWVEIGVGLAMAVFALVVIAGSLDAGIDWGEEGPKAGFFPFYVALFILVASVGNVIQAWTERADRHLFAEWGQLGQVLAVVLPTAIYVGVIPYIGIYVASVMLIAFFMMWLGRYSWTFALPISIAVPLVTFVIFELWFLVPLPKGPLEDFLGF
jgi:hypothetical protein